MARLEDGVDLVSGWKRRRLDPRGKVLASRVFNGVARRVFGLPLHDMNCGYKAYRRELVDRLRPYGELHRFLPVFARALGAEIAEVEVRHRPRRYGRSKYDLTRLPKGFLDLATVLLLTRYRDRPLHLFALAATGVAAGAALAAGALALAVPSASAWAAGMAVVGMGLAGQLVAAGLVAELVRSDRDVAPAAEEYERAGHPERLASNE